MALGSHRKQLKQPRSYHGLPGHRATSAAPFSIFSNSTNTPYPAATRVGGHSLLTPSVSKCNPEILREVA
jgi:hypothetical protein